MERLPFRIGHGYDVHRLVENRKLILGGVEIPYEKGLLGHSDADVLLHAGKDRSSMRRIRRAGQCKSNHGRKAGLYRRRIGHFCSLCVPAGKGIKETLP